MISLSRAECAWDVTMALVEESTSAIDVIANDIAGI